MFRIISNADPKYLAATDLLIGDMSNINYEFLLFDRPIVLLANEWLMKNFPDIGIKTDLRGLQSAIKSSLANANEYQKARELWLERTISQSMESASKRYIDIILNKSDIALPIFIFIHGNSSIRQTNLLPLVEQVQKRGFEHYFIGKRNELKKKNRNNVIIVAAHFCDLWEDIPGYKVHIDHDLKGVATANLEYAIWEYKKHKYFPHIEVI